MLNYDKMHYKCLQQLSMIWPYRCYGHINAMAIDVMAINFMAIDVMAIDVIAKDDTSIDDTALDEKILRPFNGGL